MLLFTHPDILTPLLVSNIINALNTQHRMKQFELNTASGMVIPYAKLFLVEISWVNGAFLKFLSNKVITNFYVFLFSHALNISGPA